MLIRNATKITHTAQSTITRTPTQITLDAGAGNDVIRVSKQAANCYSVSVNGQNHYFNQAEMAKLTIKGGSGNDRIQVDANVDIALRVQGGSGKDTIINHARGTRISGGSGNDTIHNTGANARLNGGSGQDWMVNTGAGAVVKGGSGNDFITNHGHGARVSGNSGHDSVTNYGQNARVHGGLGNDQIVNRGNGAYVNGGWGHDRVDNVASGVRVYGCHGNDNITSRGNYNRLLGGSGYDYVRSAGVGNAAGAGHTFRAGVTSTDVRASSYLAAQAHGAVQYNNLMARADAALGAYRPGMLPTQQGMGTLNQMFPQPGLGGLGQNYGAPNPALSALSDPSLTVEDKVALTLMMVMNQMDKEIEGQTQKIQALQGQGGQAGQSSIDVESMKLNRLVTKRQQMFDTLRSIIDKYNETAKNTIQSMGR